jgi:hypothetical protein
MKTSKIKSIEILTNGCLNFSYSNHSRIYQIKINEKDYQNLIFLQKRKKNYNKVFVHKTYKQKYKV